MTPKAPSTYILRKMNEVELPDSVSWMPQTIGWKILLLVVCVGLSYLLYRRLKFQWVNRYRKEAIQALHRVSSMDPQWPLQLFKIVKIVLNHLDRRNAPLYGTGVLEQMKNYMTSDERQFNQTITLDETALLSWLTQVEQGSSAMELPPFEELVSCLESWLIHHQPPSIQGKQNDIAD